MKIRSINPMVRAVGTMGAIAALVGGVTFAALTSNSVALSPNTLDVANASLEIGDSGCGNLSHTSFPGFNTTTFSQSQPASVTFCLHNDGGVPLNITGTVSEATPGSLAASVAAQNTTLTIQCGSDPAISGTLNTGWNTTFPTALSASGGQELCTATASLGGGYTGHGNEAIPSFSINFQGTEPVTT